MTHGPILAHWRFVLEHHIGSGPVIRQAYLSTSHIYNLIGLNPAGGG